MVRLMYDGVDADTVPAGAALYAGYVDGQWQSYQPLVAKFPGARHVAICVSPLDDGQVLDVEQGDASPDQAPEWVERQRARGYPYPAVYCNQENSWASVRAAFAEQVVGEPLYWLANYVGDPAQVPQLPDGAIALQFYDYGGYDASVVADYWPGVDPVPVHTVQLEESEDGDMTTTSVAGRAGLSWAAGSRHVVQVGYDPAGGDPTLRVVLVLTTGPLVVTEGWKLTPTLGTGVYELPEAHIAACRGVILEWASGSEQVTYDVTAV